ncbi:hypothetical protein LXA43DRAFT_1060708 [Ganoderma leucocontextum]|nr:hypothetical protein LXA43DRAFT_1060708 [Ganoderma leucocontextum]
MDYHPPAPSPAHPSASIVIRAIGDRPWTGQIGNVILELLHPGKPPLWIMLPFTQEEGTRQTKHWEGCWRLVKEWPGASGLSDEQWVLLASLHRVLFWFAHDKNDGTVAAWPGFIRSYLLLGELGRHFRKNITVNGTVLLHLLMTWAQEHVPKSGTRGSSLECETPIVLVSQYLIAPSEYSLGGGLHYDILWNSSASQTSRDTPLMDYHPPAPSPAHPSASIVIRAIGDRPWTGQIGNVILELLHPGKPPLWIMLPFTQEEGTRQTKHWEGCWRLVKEWPGASGLSDEQWVLLASLHRVLFWFAHDKNDGTVAAWPGFIRSYLLLGELGRHFRKNITVNGTVLLHLLMTWAQEHVPVRHNVPPR